MPRALDLVWAKGDVDLLAAWCNIEPAPVTTLLTCSPDTEKRKGEMKVDTGLDKIEGTHYQARLSFCRTGTGTLMNPKVPA